MKLSRADQAYRLCCARQGADYRLFLFSNVINVICTCLFLIEAVCKIYGLGWRLYISDDWNRIDFVILVFSLLDVIFFLGDIGAETPVLTRSWRVFRVVRALRLAKSVRSIRGLLETLFTALPALINVGSVLLLIFFIYAIVGVSQFGSVETPDLDPNVSFENILLAFLVLFRVATGT